MKRTANKKKQKTRKIQTTHLKDPMTHPRGERHLHDGQTAIAEKCRLLAVMVTVSCKRR